MSVSLITIVIKPITNLVSVASGCLSTSQHVPRHYYHSVLISLSLLAHSRSFPPPISHPGSLSTSPHYLPQLLFLGLPHPSSSLLTPFPVVFCGSLVSFSSRVTWFCLSQPEGKKTVDSGSSLISWYQCVSPPQFHCLCPVM